MKKFFSFVLMVVLCLALLPGCAQDGTAADTTEVSKNEKYCRVMRVENDGIFVWVDPFDHVFVKNVDPNLGIEPLDTVIIDFMEGDLVPASGEFLDAFYHRQNYSYILENYKSIRFPDPSAGEPTFG